MSYARYGRDSDWYIFWHATNEDAQYEQGASKKPKGEEILAIWHITHRAKGPLFTYVEVEEMLRKFDFSRIPGYSEEDKTLIAGCLAEFIRDVDHDRRPV